MSSEDLYDIKVYGEKKGINLEKHGNYNMSGTVFGNYGTGKSELLKHLYKSFSSKENTMSFSISNHHEYDSKENTSIFSLKNDNKDIFFNPFIFTKEEVKEALIEFDIITNYTTRIFNKYTVEYILLEIRDFFKTQNTYLDNIIVDVLNMELIGINKRNNFFCSLLDINNLFNSDKIIKKIKDKNLIEIINSDFLKYYFNIYSSETDFLEEHKKEINNIMSLVQNRVISILNHTTFFNIMNEPIPQKENNKYNTLLDYKIMCLNSFLFILLLKEKEEKNYECIFTISIYKALYIEYKENKDLDQYILSFLDFDYSNSSENVKNRIKEIKQDASFDIMTKKKNNFIFNNKNNFILYQNEENNDIFIGLFLTNILIKIFDNKKRKIIILDDIIDFIKNETLFDYIKNINRMVRKFNTCIWSSKTYKDTNKKQIDFLSNQEFFVFFSKEYIDNDYLSFDYIMKETEDVNLKQYEYIVYKNNGELYIGKK